MTPKVSKTDNTRNQRQARRREREKQWLKENGWQSWEALHTALVNGSVRLITGVVVAPHELDDRHVSDTKDHG
jgi:hypothetical protein